MPPERKKIIVFVNPPVMRADKGDFRLKREVSVPPEGLCYLAACTREAGFNTYIIDAPNLGFDHGQATENILNLEPHYVGITAVTITIHDAARLAKMVKEKAPEVVTIIGGVHVTVLPERTMELFPEFDIGVIGEGEVTIVELLQALSRGEDLSKVKGIIIRRNSNLIRTEARPFIQNLDILPFPAWDLLPHLGKYYKQSVARASRFPAASLVTSRGCPGKCAFCALSVFGNRLRGFSAERVYELFRHLAEEYGIRSIVINDDNFVVFRKRLKELCERLLQEPLGLTWSCFSRVDNVTSEVLQLMKKAGCTDVAYGIESGSQRLLDECKKGITLKQAEEAVKWSKDAGLKVTGYFIIGFLGETRATMEETIAFAKKLPLDDFLLSYMVPYPGCELYQKAHELGEFNEDWANMNQWEINFIPRGLTREEMESYFKRAFREFYLRPGIMLGHARQALSPCRFPAYLREGTEVIQFLLSRK